MSERNLKRLLWGLAGALAVFLLCLIPIFIGENAPPWAIWGTCVGGVAVLFFWSALVVASLMARTSTKRRVARPMHSRARVASANLTRHRRHESAPGIRTPLQQVAPDPDNMESFFLAEPDPEADPVTDRQADIQSPRRAAFRALGIRIPGAAALPLEDFGPDDRLALELLMAQAEESGVSRMASESDDSHGAWLRRVPGTNGKGRLCWICGRKHGPEIVHNSSIPLNGLHITVEVAERLGWLDGADYGGGRAPPG
jgi:hypothetical protein